LNFFHIYIYYCLVITSAIIDLKNAPVICKVGLALVPPKFNTGVKTVPNDTLFTIVYDQEVAAVLTQFIIEEVTLLLFPSDITICNLNDTNAEVKLTFGNVPLKVNNELSIEGIPT
jgi:hypothetical protein